MSERFKISVHNNGFYQVSIPNYYGGEVVRAETYDKLRSMLVNVLDAHYGATIHHIGDGDGLLGNEAADLREFWATYLDDVAAAVKEPK